MPHDESGSRTAHTPSETKPVDSEGHGHGQGAHPGRRPGSSFEVPASLVPTTGWHFLHLFYKIDRDRLRGFTQEERAKGRDELAQAFSAKSPGAIEQMQCFGMLGHKADFGLMLAGPDLKALHAAQVAIQASTLGPALVPAYSFYSITEVSEYVPDEEEYGRILRERENADPESDIYKAKVASYAKRLVPMNEQRLHPEFPDWPCFCFYPMSKMRSGDQNWYLLPFETRSTLMSQHGRSGMMFAGKVSQVITASTGLDDWEWGVTLWAKNPIFLKDIVYTMRFDESSAKYALFGDFYFGYFLPPAELIETLKL